jgi:hypothetical protein
MIARDSQRMNSQADMRNTLKRVGRLRLTLRWTGLTGFTGLKISHNLVNPVNPVKI